MTAIRTSLAFAIEDKFCGGPGGSGTNKGKWLASPPNSFLTHGHQRSTNRMNSAGTKKFDYIAYGSYNGTWSWSFTADYEYLEPLLGVFEEYSHEELKEGTGQDTYAPTVASTGYTVTTVNKLPTGEEGDEIDGDSTIYLITHADGSVTGHIYLSAIESWVEFATCDKTMTLSAQYLQVMYVHNGDYYNSPIQDPNVSGGYLADQAPVVCYKSTSNSNKSPAYFDTLRFKILTVGNTQVIANSDNVVQRFGGEGAVYKHVFKKKDNGRVRSLCFRRVQLNTQVGGKHGDEILEIYGAVCTEFRMSVSAGSSQVQVNMSGFSAKEAVRITNLDATEYQAYDGEHVMFACLFNDSVPSAQTYVADVQTLQIAVKNNAERLWNTCSPFMTNYYEGITNYEITANVYSKDPLLFRNRLYSGGRDITSEDAGFKTTTVQDVEGKSRTIQYLERPLCKGLAPMAAMTISSYDTCRDLENNYDIGTTISEANFRFDINASDIVFKTMSWERGDSSKLMDNLSSSECRELVITVYSDVEDYSIPNAKRYINIKKENMIMDNTN